MTAFPFSTFRRTRPTSGRPTPIPAFFMAQAIPASGRFSQSSFTARRVSFRPVPSSQSWPFGRMSPGPQALRQRISHGVSPASFATRLRHDSMAKHDCVTPKPRKAPPGGLFV